MEEYHQALSRESQLISPPASFTSNANLKSYQQYLQLYTQSLQSPQTFWPRIASDLHWFQPWTHLIDTSNKPFFKWFLNAKTNLCYNCVDRNLQKYSSKTAIVYQGQPGDTQTLTYLELFHQTCVMANTLLSLGIRKGDCVAIYMPMTPYGLISILACSRIGAIHNVIFAGFSQDSIQSRLNDSSAKLVITSDGLYRRGKLLALKQIIDKAILYCPSVKNILVIRRHPENNLPCHIEAGRDIWYHQAREGKANTHEAQSMDSQDMSFLLYTSGTTGTPKGIVHTTAGYMVGAYLTTKYVFDMQNTDIFWCTADIGWITGHTYVTYGPLLNASTVFIYEGAPNYPDQGRFWDLIQKYRITIFYTAPTAIRTFMRWGQEVVQRYDVSSLRLLGSVGEPLNPQAWQWYFRVIGSNRCPIVDTWWQTETGSIMITSIPGAQASKAGSVSLPFFGVDPDVLQESGEATSYGWLAIKRPWPSMMRGIFQNPQRYINGY